MCGCLSVGAGCLPASPVPSKTDRQRKMPFRFHGTNPNYFVMFKKNTFREMLQYLTEYGLAADNDFFWLALKYGLGRPLWLSLPVCYSGEPG